MSLSYNFSSRKLLLLNPNPNSSSPASLIAGASLKNNNNNNTFDANVVMVLSVLLCAVICSLGLNSIVRCALRCSSFVAADQSSSALTDLNRRSAIGVATGVKKKALRTLPTVIYTSSELMMKSIDGECAICLSEFVAGEKLRLLPKCCHGFHIRCIDKWLNSHASCPKCRHNLLETCHKIVGSPPSTVAVDLSPLDYEGPVRNYRGDSS